MPDKQVLIVSEKESFIVRVLLKKIKDTGTECSFAVWNIDDINSKLGDSALITLFMDNGERPEEAVLHFLNDSMREKEIQMIVIGEKADSDYVCGHVPSELRYKTFIRPVDNLQFANAVSEYMAREKAGELKKSILIVDDDPQYLLVVREWLKDSYKVNMANSGMQAIKWLINNKVDLILLDHEMPVTSGPKVLEMLRSDEETRAIPVIFLTGKRDKESVMQVVSLKPEGYLLKNIQREELLEKLQEFFILRK